MLNLLFAAVVVIIFAAVVSFIEYLLKTKGALFSGVATPRMRLLALLLGIVFAALSIMELTSSDVIHFVFPILAVAFIGYSLGAGALLRSVQGGQSADVPSRAALPSQLALGEPSREIAEDKEPMFPLRRLGRLCLILGIGLVLAIVAVFAAVQIATHPDDSLFPLLVLGIIIVFVMVGMRRLFREQ